jgi:putative hemolysin
MALPMQWLAIGTAPVVWVLNSTSGLVFRILRLNRESENQVTAEELHLIVAEASKSGVIEEHERSIISGVVRLADRPVREVMTPRTEVDWLDIGLDEAGIREKLVNSTHTRLPVAEGSVDAVVGVVQARDIVAAAIRGDKLDLKVLMRAAPVVIDQLDAMDALVRLRRAEVPMALIHDEYGHFEGIVTPADLLAAIAGDFASDGDPHEAPDFVHRDDGSYLVAGSASADSLAEKLDLVLPDDRDYATAAGFALAAFRRLPAEGESVTDQGWVFEVVDLDGRRIDKLLVSRERD